MLIQFEQAPGSVVDTTKVTWSDASQAPVTVPILSSNFGGTITNAGATPPGSLRGFGATNSKGILVWKLPGNSVHDMWQFDDQAAVFTAFDTITAALGTSPQPALIILKSDGSLGS